MYKKDTGQRRGRPKITVLTIWTTMTGKQGTARTKKEGRKKRKHEDTPIKEI